MSQANIPHYMVGSVSRYSNVLLDNTMHIVPDDDEEGPHRFIKPCCPELMDTSVQAYKSSIAADMYEESAKCAHRGFTILADVLKNIGDNYTKRQ